MMQSQELLFETQYNFTEPLKTATDTKWKLSDNWDKSWNIHRQVEDFSLIMIQVLKITEPFPCESDAHHISYFSFKNLKC